MDLNTFLQIVQNTPLLVEEEKAYFTAKASSYTPAVRAKMFHILKHHEEHLLQVTQEHLVAMQADISAKLKIQFQQVEKEHEAEVAQAEDDLAKDLAMMGE